MSYTGTVIVIPTRNRPDLVRNAIDSVFGQASCEVEVLVSDNSTSRKDRTSLAQYCQQLGNLRLRYIAPPEPLPMSAHWDWAIEQALSLYNASHFTFLTDRMMFRPGELKKIIDIATSYPHKVISYHLDRIIDHCKPIRIQQHRWTGKLLEVDCLHLSYLYSQSQLHPCLPRLLNNIVPRGVLEAIRLRFGNVCASISPDYNFGCRCLEVLDSIIYYDKSPIVHYALDRSTGARVSRSGFTQKHAEYLGNWDSSRENYLSPIPEIISCGNAVIHEYCAVKQEAKSRRFFEIDLTNYLQYLMHEIRQLENVNLRAEMMAQLVAHRRELGLVDKSSDIARKLLSPRLILNKLRWTIGPRSQGNLVRSNWLFLFRVLGVKLSDNNELVFGDLQKTIDYIMSFPRRRSKDWWFQERLLQARELPPVEP